MPTMTTYDSNREYTFLNNITYYPTFTSTETSTTWANTTPLDNGWTYVVTTGHFTLKKDSRPEEYEGIYAEGYRDGEN